MPDRIIVNNIFDDKVAFYAKALAAMRFQHLHNPVYRQWNEVLNTDIASVGRISEIPFLPVSFFKDFELKTGVFEPQAVFESSGTTGTNTSRHFIKELATYRQSFVTAFELFYGDISDYCVIGLLPSYLERNNSSLVVMVDELIKRSAHKESGFYLYEFERLYQLLLQLEQDGIQVLLIGVTFALLDFATAYSLALSNTIVMETGGMKGRRKEMIRAEVHDFLCSRLGIETVHSEYGMTELLSQAYSKGNGIFVCPPWMRVLVRDEEDPLSVKETGRGVLNIIDLANIHSCCFIATDDVGIVYEDGSFEVLGRRDNTDIRGCSLLTV
ncbi:MAG TPA: acyl transferase [Panacibacter sp.]|nr:acyl transferase [Panacibacter sp.]HNP43370.1 acyl transferase [Panacibacter sp.]